MTAADYTPHGVSTRDQHTMSLRMPSELARSLKIFASVTDTSANHIINAAITSYLREHDKEFRAAAAERAASLTRVATDKLADL